MRQIVSPLSGIRSPFGLRDSVADFYAVAGLSPSLVFDFSSEFYRTGGSTTTFDAAMTHTRSGNATMVDSDGVLKWAPHNLLRYSEDFSDGSWSKAGVTATADSVTEDSSTGNHRILSAAGITVDAVSHTNAIEVKPNGRTRVKLTNNNLAGSTFDLVGGGTVVSGAGTIAALADGWYRIVSTLTSPTTERLVLYLDNGSGLSYAGDGVSGVFIRKAHLYRSDLGGMVDNLDTGNSYVPTTSAARYLPRRGHHIYNGAEWVNEGLLVESESRTNLVTQSVNFNTTWVLSDAGDTLTAAAASPDGLTNAYLFAPDNTSLSHALRFPFSFDALTYTISAFVKTSGRRYCHLAFGGATLGAPSYDYRRGVFDLQDGVVVSEPTDGAARIEPFEDGWYRCSVTITVITAGAANFDFYHASSATPTNNVISDGNGTDGILIYGAQLETAPTPSSYIPTSGSTATRSADVITVPSANLPYSATAMSIQMDGKMTYADTATSSEIRFVRWLADNTNYIISDYATDGAYDRMKFEQRSSGTLDNVQNTSAPYSPGINVPYNIASRHGSTFINGAVDGTALTADTTPTALPDLSSTDLNLAFDYMGTIKKFRVWSDDLGDTGIAEAST